MKRFGELPIFALASLAVLLAAPLIGGGVSLSAVFYPLPADPASMIFWQIRLPRVLLGWIAGAGLAGAGMVFQAIFRNSLATPYTLGVSAGASLGAALGMRLGLGGLLLGFSAMNLGAIVGALVAIGLVYGLTRLRREC
ncbi:MAG: iron chelate uptake ABC transporter family permease subunit, partial [Candidatus Aminicenantes bacterium]|nr:iron chelate uptake ABC transporter family permease subunit [Candidatus Aminicenantes bacterium]